ncbi:MAG: carbohydrate-binding family 9-like protein [Bacteroidota bacterium]
MNKRPITMTFNHSHLPYQIAVFVLLWLASPAMSQDTILYIQPTEDFEIDGEGSNSAWSKTEWITLSLQHGPSEELLTRAKVLHSETGIYYLMQCEDETLTATLTEDFADLYKEDVVEVFLWTDEAQPLYFEYELSPLNYELPIIIPNRNGTFFGWRPWHYEGERLTRHATSVQGGQRESMAKVSGWTAEFFIPYALLKPLGNVPPQAGTRWRGNLYRIDYDLDEPRYWQWQPTSGSFHEYQKFGTFVFQ